MHRVVMRRGGDFDRWDLEVQGGLLGRVQLTTVIEEHGGGRQLIRFVSKPRVVWSCIAMLVLFGILAVSAGMDGVWTASTFFGTMASLIALRAFLECGASTAALLAIIKKTNGGEGETGHKEPADTVRPVVKNLKRKTDEE